MLFPPEHPATERVLTQPQEPGYQLARLLWSRQSDALRRYDVVLRATTGRGPLIPSIKGGGGALFQANRRFALCSQIPAAQSGGCCYTACCHVLASAALDKRIGHPARIGSLHESPSSLTNGAAL